MYDESWEGFGGVQVLMVNKSSDQPGGVGHSPEGHATNLKYWRYGWHAIVHLLDARRTDGVRATQTVTATLNVRQSNVMHGGFGLPPYASDLALRLRSTSPGLKFKVRMVTSC